MFGSLCYLLQEAILVILVVRAKIPWYDTSNACFYKTIGPN